MLVLTRKKGETIRIGDDIVIKVIACGRGKAKVGVEAPTTTRVLRGEILPLTNRLPVRVLTAEAAAH
jgi:carbon storage regulator